MKLIKYFDLSEDQYEDGSYTVGFVEKEILECKDDYSIFDFYSDRGVTLCKNDCDDFYYFNDDEKRFVVIWDVVFFDVPQDFSPSVYDIDFLCEMFN